MERPFTIKLPLENSYLPVLGSTPMRHTTVICQMWKERLAEDGLWKMELAFAEHLLFTVFQKTDTCQALGSQVTTIADIHRATAKP